MNYGDFYPGLILKDALDNTRTILNVEPWADVPSMVLITYLIVSPTGELSIRKSQAHRDREPIWATVVMP